MVLGGMRRGRLELQEVPQARTLARRISSAAFLLPQTADGGTMMTKQIWWWIGDPHAPAYVSGCMALAWAGLAVLRYRIEGFGKECIFCIAACALRFGM